MGKMYKDVGELISDQAQSQTENWNRIFTQVQNAFWDRDKQIEKLKKRVEALEQKIKLDK